LVKLIAGLCADNNQFRKFADYFDTNFLILVMKTENYYVYNSLRLLNMLEHYIHFWCWPVFNFARAVQSPPV